MTVNNTTPARVEIDATDHRDVFPALVRTDDRWNGFAIPYFDLPTVHRLADWVRRFNGDYCDILIDSDGETVIVVESDGAARDDETGEYVYVQRVAPVDGLGYCIGGYAWTWIEVEDDAPTDDDELDAWLADRARRAAVYCAASNAVNAERVANGEPYDAAFRERQDEAGRSAVAALGAHRENGDIVCSCGNTPGSDGFATCLPDGTEVEPLADGPWAGHYRCGSCGAVHHYDSLPETVTR